MRRNYKPAEVVLNPNWFRVTSVCRRTGDKEVYYVSGETKEQVKKEMQDSLGLADIVTRVKEITYEQVVVESSNGLL